jgi:hypothetical protein
LRPGVGVPFPSSYSAKKLAGLCAKLLNFVIIDFKVKLNLSSRTENSYGLRAGMSFAVRKAAKKEKRKERHCQKLFG